MNKVKSKYGIYKNFKYIFKKQWSFSKYSVLVQGIRIISGVLMALAGVGVTKIVLDSLEKNLKIETFLVKFIPMVLLLALFTCLNYISNISMKRVADCMRYACYVKEINDLAIREDYSSYISPEGKNKRQKAEIAVGDSGESGINKFFTNITELAKNILGFLSYITVLFLLNPLIIVLLIGSYAVDSLVASRIQKWIQRTKDKRAVIKRKLNYMAYRTRALSAAKDIRMYDMSQWLEEHGKRVLDEVENMYEETANKRFKRSMIEHLLVFLRDGLAYGYLIYLVLKKNMTIGDFAAYLALIAGFSEWLRGIVEVFSSLVESNYYVEDFRVYVDSVQNVNNEDKMSIDDFQYPYTITFKDVCG